MKIKFTIIQNEYISSFYSGIVSDLFPLLEEKPVDYGILEAEIRATSLRMGLEDVDGIYFAFFNSCFFFSFEFLN